MFEGHFLYAYMKLRAIPKMEIYTKSREDFACK